MVSSEVCRFVAVESAVWTECEGGEGVLGDVLSETYAATTNLVTVGFRIQGKTALGSGSQEINREDLLAMQRMLHSSKEKAAQGVWFLGQRSASREVVVGMVLANAGKVRCMRLVTAGKGAGEGELDDVVDTLISAGIYVTLCTMAEVVKGRSALLLEEDVLWRGRLFVKSLSKSCDGLGLRLIFTASAKDVRESIEAGEIQLLRLMPVDKFVTVSCFFRGPELCVYCLDKRLYPRAEAFIELMLENPREVLVGKLPNGQLLVLRRNHRGSLVANMAQKDNSEIRKALLSTYNVDTVKPESPGQTECEDEQLCLPLLSEPTSGFNGKNTGVGGILETSSPQDLSSALIREQLRATESVQFSIPPDIPHSPELLQRVVLKELKLVSKVLDSFGVDRQANDLSKLPLRPAISSARRTSHSNRVSRKRGERMVAMQAAKTPGKSSLRNSIRASDLFGKRRAQLKNRSSNSRRRHKAGVQQPVSFKDRKISSKNGKGSNKAGQRSTSQKPKRTETTEVLSSEKLREKNLSTLRKLIALEVWAPIYEPLFVIPQADHYAKDLDVKVLGESDVRDKLSETCKFAVFLKGSKA